MKFDPYAFAKEHGLDAASCAIRATCAIPAHSNSTNSTNSTPQPSQSESATLAEISASPVATPATTVTNPPRGALVSPLPQRHSAEIKPRPQPAEVRAFAPPEIPAPSATAPSRPALSLAAHDAFPYGRSFDGKPMTWTGKVVSLEAWRRLSDWQKHGSTGMVWNGLTQAWEPMDGGAESRG